MKTVLLAVCVFAAAYYMTEPLPAGWKQPWKTRCVLTFERLFRVLINGAGLLGYDLPPVIDAGWAIGLDLMQTTAHLEDVIGVEVEKMEGVETHIFRKKQESGRKLPGMVFFHGGGWISSNPYLYRNTIRRMVRDTGAVGIAMDYRLAPTHPFPAGVEDCVNVAKYFMSNAEKYGVDPDRIFFSGDSAGGHLTVVVAMKLKAENFHIQPKLLAITYPALQGINLQTPSYQGNAGDPLLSVELMAYVYTNHAKGNSKNAESYVMNQHVPKDVMDQMMETYMPLDALPDDDFKKNHKHVESPSKVEFWDDVKDILMNPYFTPLLAPEEMLEGLPNIFMNVCQRDILRDEGLWFARRLAKAYVSVELDLAECFHAWNLYTEDLESASEAMDRVTDYINKHI